MGDTLPFGADFGSGPDPASNGGGSGPGFSAFARLASAMLALLAGAVGIVLTMVFAATLAVLTVLASVLLALASLALRFGRRRAAGVGPVVMEARKVGHSWVAYGWDQPRR